METLIFMIIFGAAMSCENILIKRHGCFIAYTFLLMNNCSSYIISCTAINIMTNTKELLTFSILPIIGYIITIIGGFIFVEIIELSIFYLDRKSQEI